MTPDFDLMPAGPEMDALVAERVMGFVWDESRCRVCGWPLVEYPESGCRSDNCSMRPVPKRRADAIPPYSTDDVAAWQVFDKFDDLLVSTFNHRPSKVYRLDEERAVVVAEATSRPLAICRAALKSVAPDKHNGEHR